MVVGGVVEAFEWLIGEQERYTYHEYEMFENRKEIRKKR